MCVRVLRILISIQYQCYYCCVHIGEWSAWSRCSRDCGGGTRTRTRGCDSQGRGCQVESETCNSEPCSPEPGLQGLTYVGCYYLLTRYSNLISLEGATEDLSDLYSNRTEPVRKCGQGAQEYNYTMFGLIKGYCASGSNDTEDYTLFGESDNCQNGIGDIRVTTVRRGSQYYRYYLYSMDVYRISNLVSFEESVQQILNPGSAATTILSSQFLVLLLLCVCVCLNFLI